MYFWTRQTRGQAIDGLVHGHVSGISLREEWVVRRRHDLRQQGERLLSFSRTETGAGVTANSSTRHTHTTRNSMVTRAAARPPMRACTPVCENERAGERGSRCRSLCLSPSDCSFPCTRDPRSLDPHGDTNSEGEKAFLCYLRERLPLVITLATRGQRGRIEQRPLTATLGSPFMTQNPDLTFASCCWSSSGTLTLPTLRLPLGSQTTRPLCWCKQRQQNNDNVKKCIELAGKRVVCRR